MTVSALPGLRRQALDVLLNVNRSGAKYLLTSTHPEESNNRSIRTYREGHVRSRCNPADTATHVVSAVTSAVHTYRHVTVTR